MNIGRGFLLALALCAVTLVALHGRVWKHPFISDDYIFLEETQHPTIGGLFTGFGVVQNYYRPLGRELYFFLGQRVFGLRPAVFRLFNFLVLAGIVVAIALLARRLAGSATAALAAASYALLYPHRVLLTWISCAQDLLATCGAAAAAWLHVAGRRRLGAAAFFLALFAKESIAPLPLVLAVYEVWAVGREKRKPGAPAPIVAGFTRTAWLWGALAVWAGVVFGIRTLTRAWNKGGGALPVADVVLDPSTMGEGFRYAIFTFFNVDQPGPALIAAATSNPAPWIAMLAVAAIAFLAGRMARQTALPRGKSRAAFPTGLLVLGVVWAIVGSVPVALAGHHFSAYYVTFAAVGAALATAAVLSAVPWPLAAIALALGAFGNGAANGTDTFRNARVRQGREGVSYVTYARLDWEARYLDAFRGAFREVPPARGTQIFLGNVPQYLGAASADGRAPRIWFADSTITTAFVSRFRQRDRSRPTRTLRFDRDAWHFIEIPEPMEIAISEGEYALAHNDGKAALPWLQQALALAKPGLQDMERAGTANNLGMAQAMVGDTVGAMQSWTLAVTLDPKLREAQLNLATLDIRAGRVLQAKERLDGVLNRDFDDAPALWYRAMVQNVLGDRAAAERDLDRLQTLDPRFADSVLTVAKRLKARSGKAPLSP